MANPKNPRVAINAQILQTGTWGGVEQFIIGLVGALGKLEGPEEYVIVAHPGNHAWLNAYLGANQRVVRAPSQFEFAKQWLGPFRVTAGKMLARVQSFARPVPQVRIPDSDGFYEALNVAVMYFPFPYFVKCNLPMVITLHDVQHLHYPQFFSRQEIVRRNVFFPAACNIAQALTTDAPWSKQDICRQYGIASTKVFAIPMAPATDVSASITRQALSDVQQKFRLPEIFALYPANTWEHKNHLRLLEAIAWLREHAHLSVNLVCTGRQNDFWRVIEKRVNELRLHNQVWFLGYVNSPDLRALYHLAQFVVIPSLFEGGGLPVLEAFREDAPVACSNVTSLPEYAGDAALLFDPMSVASIADALCQMATDADVREALRQRGRTRVRRFTWERTAKTYRALYRQVARAPLSDEDRALLTDALG